MNRQEQLKNARELVIEAAQTWYRTWHAAGLVEHDEAELHLRLAVENLERIAFNPEPQPELEH